MSLIGIIANPSAGKDIRRLVADADNMHNRQKVNIVRRVLKGIEGVGTDEVSMMPDPFGIGALALDGLNLQYRVSHIDMPVSASQEDSKEAATILRDREAGCIVVLGGDGTHRAVAKGCRAVPLVPISTGTNNVWPQQNEGTLAGLAAALVAQRTIPLDLTVQPTRRLEVVPLREQKLERRESPIDIALVDVAAYDSAVIGSKAVWEVDRLKQLFLANVEAATLGLSAIGGSLPKPSGMDDVGMHLRVGTGGTDVLAAIAPGMICRVPIVDHHWLRPGESVAITNKPCVLALDGEREIVVSISDEIGIRLTGNGPNKVDVRKTLQVAADHGIFVQDC